MTVYEEQDSYPVIVEETRRYVVWVEADNAKQAVEIFSSDPYDPGRDSMYRFDWDCERPDKYDWESVTRPSEWGWQGLECDAHIRSYRNHLAYLKQESARAVCVAAGHPFPDNATGPQRWPDYCVTCGPIDPATRTAAA